MFTRHTFAIKALFCILGALFLPLLSAQASETVLHSFSSDYMTGANPIGQLAVYSGAFYGVTYNGINGYGDIFKMSSKGAITVLHEFNGADGYGPFAGLTLANGTFYGTTQDGGSANLGVLYKIAPNGSGFTVLHNFGGQGAGDGKYPKTALTLASDGKLYGATTFGGIFDQGTLFRYDPSSGSYLVLHSFYFPEDGAGYPTTSVAEGTDGALYGVNGSIFKINKDGTGCVIVHTFAANGSDPAGIYPYSDLIRATDGNLYGTCSEGGLYGMGTVFRLVTSTGAVTPVWSFDGYTGAYPGSQCRLLQGSDGSLYGVMSQGGYYDYGTAFKLSLSGACSVLADFDYWNAGDPGDNGGYNGYGVGSANPLVQYGANFYCTSFSGGQFALQDGSFSGYGAALSISSTGVLKVLNSFHQREGWNAYAPLVQSGSSFYGETYYGGEYGYGFIYKTDGSGHVTALHHFNDIPYHWEGTGPDGSLLLARDGSLYGLTFTGGRYSLSIGYQTLGTGTLFKMTTKGAFSVLHELLPIEGATGHCAPAQGIYPDNNLYGTLGSGGLGIYYGSLFCTDTAGKNFYIIHNFTGPDGGDPECTPVPDGQGNLYGTCAYGGAYDYGTIWKCSTNGATFTKLYDFDGTHGAYPLVGGKLALVNGYLYGVTANGGANNQGILFKLNLSTNQLSVFHSFNNNLGEGNYPQGGLTYDAASGTFFGACAAGGSANLGTIYKIALSSGAFSLLHAFTGLDGANPDYWPILGTDGYLYGTTPNGGDDGLGAIFKQTATP